MKQNFTLLVNSTDGYSDCWEPFFTLFAKFWPEYEGKIYLNAETKTYSHPGLNIVCSQSQNARPDGSWPTWTECLTHTLNQIPTDMVLYVQEDYFLKDHVNHQLLLELTNLAEQERFTYFSIVDCAQRGPFHPTEVSPHLWKIDQNDQYRISLQACLISKERFSKYLRKHENPWQFEYYGNMRARRKPDAFFTVNRDLHALNKAPIFPYEATGIITKKWKREIVEKLFEQHNIQVDYTQRGWHESQRHLPAPKRPLTLKKIIATIKSLI